MATDGQLRVRVSLDGATQTTAEAQRIERALKGVNTEARAGSQASGGVRKVSDEVGGLSGKIDSMTSLGGKLLVGSGVIGSVVALASAYKDAALQADKLKNTYAFAFGSVSAGAANLAYIKSTSNGLGTSLLATADAYGKLAAASVGTNLEGTKTRAIFEAVSKATTVVGLSSAETSGALLAVQQMMSKGTVQAEELRGQLGERLPGAFQIAARAMGVSTAELGKMLEQGKVLSDDFLPKFAAELEKTFGASAARAADSFQARLNRMENAWETFKMSLAAPAAGSGGGSVFDSLAESLNTAAAGMDRLAQNGEGMFKRFFYGLGSVEMDVMAWMAGAKSPTTAVSSSIARDDGWINRKLNEISRLKAEADKEPGYLKDRFSASSQLKTAQQELDDAIAVRNSNPGGIQLRDKDGARAAAKKHMEGLAADRLSLYDAFNKEVAGRDATLKKSLELETFDKKWAGMAVENPAFFADARAKLVANLDAAIARESGKGSRKSADPDRLHDARLRELQQQAAQEMHDLQAADRKQKAMDRAQAAMDRTVGNLEDTYKRQNAIYNEKQMTAPQRELEAALRKVEEAADAAREALSQKAATLEVDDVQAMEAYRAAIVRVSEAESAQLDQVKALQAEQERLNSLWETGAERALTKYMDTTKNVADEVEEAFTRGFQGMEVALMSFVTTGKANFGDLAKAIIADLARIELKALLFGDKGSGGGSGIGDLVKGALGLFGGGSGFGTTGTTNAFMTNGVALASANGNVFSGSPSLHRYANTIIDRPTPFTFGTLHRFANGGAFAGVGGEAGPEAVMPLTRDSSGRLGVRSEGGSSGATHITLNFPGVTGSAAEVRRAGGEVARQVRGAVQGAGRYA